ncbi:MAG: exodeoxyribonuclease VII large subunit [Rubrivivax sp.]
MDLTDSRPLDRSWSVSALLLAVSDALTARWGGLTVAGELSGFSRAASGHCYFSLKDADGAPALVRCAMFRRAASLLDFAPTDGQRVEVRGRLALYEPRGELQFIVESMRRQGAGSLYEEFLRLRARLEAAGLFDPQRRRPLPAFARVIGVVSSLGAAALQDVLTALARRAPHVRVVVYPCQVQGSEAPPTIVQALRRAAEHAQADLLLLVRGGGSLEDLWAFNDERVVRAVSASPLPVVCGVGHETDVTLCDLAADLRAPTPTAAAELAAALRDDLLGQLHSLQVRLLRACRRTLERQAQRLDLLAERAQRPRHALATQAQRLGALEARLRLGMRSRAGQSVLTLQGLEARWQRAMAAALEQRHWRLQVLASRLEASNPRGVLKRGYAWVARPDGQPVSRARDLRPGDAIEAVFDDGLAKATVDTVLPEATHPETA